MSDVPIVTASLVLRRFVAQDAASALVLSNEPAFRRWLPNQVYADAAEAQAAVEYLVAQYTAPADPRLGPYVLAIDHRLERRLIGHVGFSPIGRDVEVGFAVAERYHRHGLGTEAVVAACGWAFRRFGLARILAITANRNALSKALLGRAGFGHEEDRVMQFQGTNQLVSVYARSEARVRHAQ